jgi:serine/threonine-protein kinase HipA
MVFNYLSDNKDDHCKNFSFLVQRNSIGKWIWRLAPAYDLTRCSEGYNGEHATSVNGTGNPTTEDMIAVGAKGKLDKTLCLDIINSIKSICKSML